MVPKLHAKGRSFRGAALYLLHDKGRAKSSDRVAWTETRNLATDNPQHAWKIMASTALDQARLKNHAGVKNTGRKSADSVLHMTLSWHPEEKPGLSKDEMMRAALGAVRALRADDRQVLFVCHSDEPQPHVHVLINRVSPADGRMLSSSKEKLALSAWAEAYEKERGQVLCEERVVNNAARKRGEYVRGEPDTPRHIHELEAANAHKRDIDRVQRQQKAADFALARKRREQAKRRARAWSHLVESHRSKLAAIRAAHRQDCERARTGVRAALRPQWTVLLRSQSEQLRAFEANEERFLGRMKNRLSAIDFRSIIRAGQRSQAIGQAFDAIASKGARLEAFKRVQAKDRGILHARQRAEESVRVRALRELRDQRIFDARTAFLAERQSLALIHGLEDAAQRNEWSRRSVDRRAAFERHRSGEDERQQQRPERERLSEQLKRAEERGLRPRHNRPRKGW